MITPKTDWRPDDYENYTDWNRQNSNIQYISEMLREFGYAIDYTHMEEADDSTIPLLALINTLEGNLAKIEACGITLPLGWDLSKVWVSGQGPAYTDWNRWERNMALLEEMATRIAAAWYYSGDLYAGEV